MGLQIKIRNRDFFPLEYKRVRVSIGYRGNDLGKVKVKGSDRIPARGTTIVKAELKVDGARVVRDVVKLIEDVAHGGVTFDTDTTIKGTLFIFGFLVPIQEEQHGLPHNE
ncbi:hypothetical protein QJS10_CPA02g00243 [Acorus calamus]|uniref:Late embryogenesis abundant protein LEA-2 subgroup domain-containing protein n=1 Tax=Acorus calamus TaxID=4465 RepID=A0AAV9FGX9_ACOCL|nr:hypothetical protein QJS10_CPA02g00248 [Acorus calamus]KAK1323739.1 hypothetical protein QJS10_CPA02g00243 [Acorus calamus]